MRRTSIVAFAFVAATTTFAHGDPLYQCYEIVTPHAQAGPPVDLLVDKCTGASWFLSPVQVAATQTTAAYYYWQWIPISSTALPGAAPAERH